MSNFNNREPFYAGGGKGHILIKSGKSPVSTVECIPTNVVMNIPVPGVGPGEPMPEVHRLTTTQPALGVITWSLNDGPKKTKSIVTELDILEFVDSAPHGGWPFFFNIMFGENPSFDPETETSALIFLGLGADGVNFNGVDFNPIHGFIDLHGVDGTHEKMASNLVPEANVIKFYPTPNEPRETDLFYAISGDTSAPYIALHSCYKAVIEEPVVEPGTCVPVDALLTDYRSGEIPHPDFSVGGHARYRINGGEWVDYVMDMNSEYVPTHYKDVWRAFSYTITVPTVLPNGVFKDVPIIASGGGVMVEHDNGDGTWDYFNLPSPFWDADYGYNHPVRLQSSRSTTDPSQSNPEGGPRPVGPRPEEVVDDVGTTIEFVTSQGVGVDLVEAFFGGDVTAHACGRANWPGL